MLHSTLPEKLRWVLAQRYCYNKHPYNVQRVFSPQWGVLFTPLKTDTDMEEELGTAPSSHNWTKTHELTDCGRNAQDPLKFKSDKNQHREEEVGTKFCL